MKHVVSISIGSSKRNHRAELEIMGEKFIIERIGTDGDMDRAVELVRQLDGKVDAFGLGGMDMYISRETVGIRSGILSASPPQPRRRLWWTARDLRTPWKEGLSLSCRRKRIWTLRAGAS